MSSESEWRRGRRLNIRAQTDRQSPAVQLAQAVEHGSELEREVQPGGDGGEEVAAVQGQL